MDARQTLNVVDKYFNTLEIFGNRNRKDYIALLYMIFIDEYYEFKRDISLNEIENDGIGLTDCLVKTLNYALEVLKTNTTIFKGIDFDYLPSKNHWAIHGDVPDTPDDPDIPTPTSDYIEDGVLITTDPIISGILITSKKIINKVLQL